MRCPSCDIFYFAMSAMTHLKRRCIGRKGTEIIPFCACDNSPWEKRQNIMKVLNADNDGHQLVATCKIFAKVAGLYFNKCLRCRINDVHSSHENVTIDDK